jgi:ParB-like chromosome segregation protein Spo0J
MAGEKRRPASPFTDLQDVKISDINIGRRHCRDMGDLRSLAESIRQEGLLQPIGVTERLELVFGQRRTLAIRDILKRKTILARVVNVSSILAGEYAENEIRKDFTPSERVAIQLGRRYHGIDTSAEYRRITERRIAAYGQSQ